MSESDKQEDAEKKKKADQIRKAYTDLNNPGSFGGLRHYLINSNSHKESKDDVVKALSGLHTFTYHRGVRNKFPRRQVFVPKAKNQFSFDLLFVHQWKRQNKGVKYLVTAIDDFTRYGYAVPVKDKK